MNILLIGSGGRENALAWKLAQSSKLTNLYAAPGNPGIAKYAALVDVAVDDFEKLYAFCVEKSIHYMVVGPEVPLVKGIKDYFRSVKQNPSIYIVGPDAKGAQLEGSKDFSKKFMQKYGIPTAAYATFQKENLTEGLTYLETLSPPYVLKADGLAAGKGVIITSDLAEAKATLKEMIENLKFGESSAKVVVEEFLKGIELSVFVLTDGKNYVLLPEAKDYKRIGEGDTGPNTGGMGAVSPVPFATPDFMQKAITQIIEPTINGLQAEEIIYTGFIFFGLINVEGNPYVIEYNCRMGDPETEVVMPRLKTDLLDLLELMPSQSLSKAKVEFENYHATTVMCVAGGYPDEYKKGDVITGFEQLKDVIVFHAGTKQLATGEIVTNGGRVAALTGTGSTKQEALAKSLRAAHTLQWNNKYFRSDIGFDL